MAGKLWFHPKDPHAKRILFHASSHVGLGHLNRSIIVAQWLKAGVPDVEVLFLIEGGEHFIEATGLPWIFVPGAKSESEHCEQITRTVLNVFRPDVMIYETFMREQIYQPIKEAGIKQALMGNVGNVLRKHFQENIATINDVDLLIILQRKEEVAPQDQDLVARYKGKTLYAGPLMQQKKQSSRGDLRQQLDLTSEDKVLLVTLGGGGYGRAAKLLENLLAAKADILEQYPQTKLIVITGPHFNNKMPKVDGFVCYVSKFEPFFTDYVDIASVVVCLAGYSTINEIVASGVPAVCVPIPESDDQAGSGGMGEYAQNFPKIALSSVDKEELTRKVLDALARERDLLIGQEIQHRVERARQSIVDEIKYLVDWEVKDK